VVKVSCILPACYGKMALLAVDCFLTQTYEDRELIVLDNNVEGETIEDLLPQDERIHYYRVPKMPVGALRNLGTSYATGEIICTWDADDWYAPTRIEEQVKRLEDSGKSVTGWHNIFYYDMSDGHTYKYLYEPDVGRNHPPYAMGTSHCYLKSYWDQHPYPDFGIEDFEWQLTAMHLGQLDSCDADQLAVARAHDGSQCPPQFGHRQFPAVPKDTLPNQFFTALRRIA
jgi:glycosyltransferase involved in cell wall biosynthesis